jgi:hypothetical protein
LMDMLLPDTVPQAMALTNSPLILLLLTNS